jgi:hypothetical protein
VFLGLSLRELCCGTVGNGLMVALNGQDEDKLFFYLVVHYCFTVGFGTNTQKEVLNEN